MAGIMEKKIIFDDFIDWNFNRPKVVNSKELYNIYNKGVKEIIKN